MRRSVLLLSLLCVALLSSAASSAQRSKQGKKRESLLEQLGLERQEEPPPAAEPSPPPPAEGDTEDDAGDDDAPSGGGQPGEGSAPKVTKPSAPAFSPRVHSLLMSKCQRCHREGRTAAKTGFALGGDATADYEAAKHFVAASPDTSPIYLEAIGIKHGGGKVLDPNGEEARLLSSWIVGGTRLGASPAAVEKTPPAGPDAPALSSASAVTTTQPSPGTPAGDAPPSPETDAPSPASPAPPSAVPAEAPAVEVYSGPTFARDIHALLVESCAACHEPEGMAHASAYALQSDPAAHYAAVRPLVNPAAPETSLLYARATGAEHDEVLATGSSEARLLLEWIRLGAHEHAPVATSGGEGSLEVATAAPGSVGGPPSSGEAPLVSPEPLLERARAVMPWLEGVRLHGRFDLSYERRNYTDNPLADGAKDALQSYHHFLFLSRRTASDPIGLDVELLTLQFWELSARHSFGPVNVGAKLGKLLVPFGADPLYHHSYGGLAGFDQRILPVVWAAEGVSAYAYGDLLGVGLGLDLSLLRGFASRGEDAVLNLQGDLSPLDDVKPALSARLRASYGPLSVYYSALLNPLGFDRLLYLQALDVSLWRWRGVPFVEDLALSFGLLRGDVSGGGPGVDHYHFGSYFQARYYAWDFLYFQYRQGLRTFDNQRGLYEDPYRFTSQDASTHSVGAVLQWRGAQLGVYHYWNLEKVDEVDDDFFRVMVGYAF